MIRSCARFGSIRCRDIFDAMWRYCRGRCGLFGECLRDQGFVSVGTSGGWPANHFWFLMVPVVKRAATLHFELRAIQLCRDVVDSHLPVCLPMVVEVDRNESWMTGSSWRR